MLIQTRLFLLIGIVILFSSTLVFSLFQVSKGAHFHKLNFLHVKHTLELKSHLLNTPYAKNLDITQINKTLLNIKQQPVTCLKTINQFDRFIMSLINTDHAIQLCEEDLSAAEEALNILDNYRNDQINSNQLYDKLLKASIAFTDNSERFEKPISKTVDFIMQSTLIPLSVLGFILIAGAVYIANGIAKSVREMDEASDALKDSEEKNRQLALFDTLTKLPNRNLLIDRLEHQINLSRRNKTFCALLFIDLDRFKQVNDSMGHHAGDKLIIKAAQRLTDCVRKSDTVSRVGGDEFNIILSEIAQPQHAEIVAKKILDTLSQPFDILGKAAFISGSVGISIFPTDTQSPSCLQKFADLALHKAKGNGRNSFELYSQDLEEEINKRIEMENHLHCALENNEFSLVFQPVVNLQTMETAGAEALIRWINPTLGFVSPVDFIPVAEDTGLIVEIGEWVLQEACRQTRYWRDNGNPEFRIAVNVSPRQLTDKKFLRTIMNTLRLNKLPTSALDIEITESIMVDEESGSANVLHQISKLGINLFLDDFGTGHSSLSYLHKLPFDVLKIDRSFVMKLDEPTESDTDIIPSIVAMAHKLKLKVVAEGVETQASLDILKKLHCEYAQGYFLSRPMPAEEIDCSRVYTTEQQTEQKTKT